MHSALAAVLSLACLPAAVAAQDAPNQTANRFLRDNPGYRDRAGTFYEKEYLPGAAAGLAKTVRHSRMSEPAAQRALRAFIYDWLDAYIAGGGTVQPEEQARLLQRLDDRIRDALCDDNAYRRYRSWRLTAQGDDNPLAFLMHSAP
jgi:hypothetical protein